MAAVSRDSACAIGRAIYVASRVAGLGRKRPSARGRTAMKRSPSNGVDAPLPQYMHQADPITRVVVEHTPPVSLHVDGRPTV